MKKIRKKLSIEFRAITLYRNDFYKIYKIFKEQCEEVIIIADNMESEESEGIDNFIDAVLKEESTKISNLDIQGHSPNISLTLTNYSTELYASNNSPKDTEVFEELCEILKPKQISNFNIHSNVGVHTYMAIFSISISVSIVVYFDIVNKMLYTSLISIIVIFIMLFLSEQMKNKHKVLHLKKEHKDKKLSNKCEKKPTICKIISGIVMFILGVIFTYLVDP